jgi:hypothetical protein
LLGDVSTEPARDPAPSTDPPNMLLLPPPAAPSVNTDDPSNTDDPPKPRVGDGDARAPTTELPAPAREGLPGTGEAVTRDVPPPV